MRTRRELEILTPNQQAQSMATEGRHGALSADEMIHEEAKHHARQKAGLQLPHCVTSGMAEHGFKPQPDATKYGTRSPLPKRFATSVWTSRPSWGG
jgi:hypothetical protein